MRGDHPLVQIVDAGLAEAARKAGDWLACRPGCFECCLGPFPISPEDADRLRRGLAEADPAVAARVISRARQSLARLHRDYPVDTIARVLEEDGAAADEPCPVLDPATGTCDLYAARPITCRTFGPALRYRDGPLAVCELCFVGATEEEIAACSVDLDLDPPGEETLLVAQALVPESGEA